MAVNPINKNWNCVQKMQKIVNSDSSLVEDAATIIKQDFEDSPDYELVYLNMDENTTYKTWVSDGTTQDKILGYKKIFSYPYTNIKFDIGNYVFFDYYHVGLDKKKDWSCWLITSLDYQNYYDVNGRCFPCNDDLKWKTDKGIIYSYPCYIEDSMKYTTLNLGQQGFTEPDGDVIAKLQSNIDTDTIYLNQRFLFRGRAYVVVQKNIEISSKVTTLFLNKVSEQLQDDIDNDIAWNGEIVIDPIKPDKTQELLLPNIDSIKSGKEIDFSIYEYINGAKTLVEFDISVSGLDLSYYQFSLIDNNNFKLKNLKQNSQKPLTITYINKTTQSIQTKDIWLKGVF